MINIKIDKQILVEGDTLEERSTQIVLAQDYCCTFLALILFKEGLIIYLKSMSFKFSPADIVLSCTVCQDTLSTIYADDDQSPGLHNDGEGPSDGKITRLWLTECAHLTCGKHLPGGGQSALCQYHKVLYGLT